MATTESPGVDDLRAMPRSERVQVLFDFEPFEYQAELLDCGEDRAEVQAAPKKGRQVGATLTAGAIAADYALTHGGEDVLVAAPFQETADELFREAKEHLKAIGDLETIGVISDNKREWEFDNGSRIISGTLGVDGVGQRGKNPSCVIIDEAAYVPDEIFNEVIEPFFLTHSSYEYYLFSTPAGKSGYYYEKVEFDDNWYSPHWPSRINPLVDREWLDQKEEEKDELTFKQEYLGEFVDESEAYLPHDLVMSCVDENVAAEGGTDRYLGVDVAREGKDSTVFVDVDEYGNVERVFSEERSTLDGVLGRIKSWHSEVGYTKILVDENGLGGGVVDFGSYDLQGVIQPFTFTSKSRGNLYKALKTAFENEDIRIPNHRRMRAELTSLQFSFTQHGNLRVTHPPNGHDDFADALALANWATQNRVKVTRRSGRSPTKSNLR